MSRAPSTLERLERWMQIVVTHPGGADAGIRCAAAKTLLPRATRNIESVVLPSRSQSSIDRLGIYAHMYYARLIEVMTAEYPTTRRILGDDAFERACRRYIERHPSTERTLQHLSAGFPVFLSRHLSHGRRGVLAVDVARIERAMEDVFDAPQGVPLTHAQLAAIAPDEWARLHVRPSPALRLLRLRTPANDYMNAARDGRTVRSPPQRPSYAVVYRHRYQVCRRTLDRAQFALLSALHDGKPLALAVRLALRHCRGEPARLAATLGGWFREWTAGGMLQAPDLRSD